MGIQRGRAAGRGTMGTRFTLWKGRGGKEAAAGGDGVGCSVCCAALCCAARCRCYGLGLAGDASVEAIWPTEPRAETSLSVSWSAASQSS